MPKVTLRPRFARRLPDPFANTKHGTERHIFYVRVADLPVGISLDPSPRAPNTRWDVYKEVQASLLDQDCSPGIFHLKNQGITIVARDVEKIEENEYQIDLDDDHGVVDGAHTYRLIVEAKQSSSIKLPRKQYVKVEVITRAPKEWLAEISGGLNTSIQGQRDSLHSLQEPLEWLKDELKDQKYFKSIAWTENERGQIDIKDLLCILTCFNTSSYPNSGTHHPVVAYENKSIVLSTFEEEFKNSAGQAYKRMQPIIKDILSLHDIVQLEFATFHHQHGSKAPGLIETTTKKPFDFPFIQAKSTERLAKGALYPMLAAFRWLIEDDTKTDTVRWRGGLEHVLRRWRELAERFVLLSAERSQEIGGNADALGRSASHWSMLHKEVALADLTSASDQTKKSAKAKLKADHTSTIVGY